MSDSTGENLEETEVNDMTGAPDRSRSCNLLITNPHLPDADRKRLSVIDDDDRPINTQETLFELGRSVILTDLELGLKLGLGFTFR